DPPGGVGRPAARVLPPAHAHAGPWRGPLHDARGAGGRRPGGARVPRAAPGARPVTATGREQRVHEHIFGIVPPMTTPFRSDGSLDEEALRAEARYLVDTARVHGLAVAGSTGEGHTMTTEEVRRATRIVLEEARGRVPVITGVITDSTASAIERGNAVRDLGVAALQVTPVHYLFRPDDDAMVRHFEALARGTGLPILIYNVVPWTYLSPSLLTRILSTVEGVIGVKQSAGDLKLLADLLLLVGNRARIMTAVD